MIPSKKRLAGVLAFLGGQAPDLLMLAGAAAIAFGAWLIFPPAGYIAGGSMVFVVGLLAARTR